MRHGLSKLDSIWGKAGSRRSIKRLVDSITNALQEYVLSSDKAECERQIRELDVPHFHHGIYCMFLFSLILFSSLFPPPLSVERTVSSNLTLVLALPLVALHGGSKRLHFRGTFGY